jgi:S-ribosylhomocysteine lyase LuxS involved in autoinducer biosynthesis
MIKSIQTKLKNSNAMIIAAEKGNSLVVLPIQQYKYKIQNFLQENNFQTSTIDPIKTFQTLIRKTVNTSVKLIPRENKWKYINLNPSAPSIEGLIKIQKPTQTFRSIVNWHNGPAYKLFKLFTHRINQLTPLPYSFNIKNTKDLIQNLKGIPILPHFTFASLDISNMYSNIPVAEAKKILSDIMKHNLLDAQTQRELLNWYYVITRQNYFISNDDIIIQNDGLAIGAPSSSIIAEIFLQHAENLHLACLTQKHSIINYFCYVDDILLIFDPNLTDIQAILTDFNALHTKLHFTAETEVNSTLNYLDISIHRTPMGLRTSIYRKPTFTDTIIPYTSNNPTQHKYAAIKFLCNRLNSYDLHWEEYQHEVDVIHSILYNNSFPVKPQKPSHLTRKQQQQQPSPTPKNKWATFTYIVKQTTYITNIFRQTDLRIAYCTNNILHNHLIHRIQHPDKFSSGVYKLTCPDCKKAYVGQTGEILQ